MRSLAWFLGLFAVAFLGAAVFAYPAWTLLHPHFDFPFHRIAERVGMLALLVGFVLVARRLGLADKASLGYGVPRRVFVREMALALGIGAVTMLAIVAIMVALDLLGWKSSPSLDAPSFAKTLVSGLLSGLAVGFIEETFLRGAMQTAIARESGTKLAITVTAVLYSATHFLAKTRIAADQVNPWSGVDLLSGALHLFAQPLTIVDAFLCLTAVGIVLGVVRAITGNIAACIGLHAGWVWVMLVVHEYSEPVRSSPAGFLLSQFDGFIGWLVLFWTMLMGVGLWAFYSRRQSRQQSGRPAAAA